MKICWDNLEKLRYSKRTGKFYDCSRTYQEYDACLVCNDPFIGQEGNQYCSMKCTDHARNGKKRKPFTSTHRERLSKSRIGDDNPNWRGGISCEPYCEVWTDKEYKNWIKYERDNGKCQNPQCSRKHIKLHLHHINYIKKDCRPVNLITLCGSCNSKANFDREWHTAYYNEIIRRKLR